MAGAGLTGRVDHHHDGVADDAQPQSGFGLTITDSVFELLENASSVRTIASKLPQFRPLTDSAESEEEQLLSALATGLPRLRSGDAAEIDSTADTTEIYDMNSMLEWLDGSDAEDLDFDFELLTAN